MAKGWPDYTRVTGIVESYDEYALNYPVGMGEAAARMGSIKTYDPRGRVAWMDDFEAAILHWDTTAMGAGSAQALDTAYSRNGNQSCRLTSGLGGGTSSITRYLSRPRNMNIGIEMHFSAAVNFGALGFYVLVRDGVNSSNVAMQIREATNQVMYLDAAGAWADTGIPACLSGELTHFHDMKITYDFHNQEYLRTMYDHQELDLTGIPNQAGGVGTPCQMFIEINNMGDTINNANAYIDDVILTYMEP